MPPRTGLARRWLEISTKRPRLRRSGSRRRNGDRVEPVPPTATRRRLTVPTKRPRHVLSIPRTASECPKAATTRLGLGSIRASRVPADAASAGKNQQGGHFYASLCSPEPAFDARRVEPHPGRGRSPTLPDVACRKRQGAAALHDASRLPVRQIHAPAFGLRQPSGAFDQQKQPCPGQSLGPASER